MDPLKGNVYQKGRTGPPQAGPGMPALGQQPLTNQAALRDRPWGRGPFALPE